jgi:hypothetical protein
MKPSGKARARRARAGTGKRSDAKQAGLLLVFFDAPDTRSVTDWLFGEHAKEVVAMFPGVWRSRSCRILNPAQPDQARWLTILESDDIAETWRYRWMGGSNKGKSAADRHGVTNRREFFVRLVNDVQRER